MSSHPQNIVVVIGVGGIGLAITRRIAHGRKLLIAGRNEGRLAIAAQSLINDGHDVTTQRVDVTDYKSVESLALAAQAMGTIDVIVSTAGLTPSIATPRQVWEVDLLGTANVIEAFSHVVTRGTSLIVTSSMSAYLIPVSPDFQKHLATAPLDELLTHPQINLDAKEDPSAYPISKMGNIYRVQAAAKKYGIKGARVNSISPGVVRTETALKEMEDSPGGSWAKKLVADSASGRIGTPEDIANAADFLAGPQSSWVTATDFLIDGGELASARWPVENL